MANSVDPDQMHYAASDLGLHSGQPVPIFRIITVNEYSVIIVNTVFITLGDRQS